MALQLSALPERYTVVRYPAEENIPDWLEDKPWMSITRTPEELSIVCDEAILPKDFNGTAEKGWKIIKIVGPLEFSMIGVLAKLSGILAEAGISLFVISTYDTDYILVKEDNLPDTLSLLSESGYSIQKN